MHDGELDAAWDDVRGRRELRGEAKLGWWYAWRKCRRRSDSVWLSYAELAVDQGAADSRTGRNILDQLTLHRFVAELERLPGRRRVFVQQPQDVLRPDEALGFTDEQQRRLPLGQRAQESAAEARSADVAHDPPADVARPPFSLSVRAHGPLPLPSNFRNEEKVRASRTTVAHGAQHPPADPAVREVTPISAALAAVLERRPGDDVVAVERIAEMVRRRVGDARLSEAVVMHVARAVVEGSFAARELEACIAWVDTTSRTSSRAQRWVLFVGCCERAFLRGGGSWPFGSARRRRGDR